MSDRFSLVRWRDAKADPPEEKGRMYQTDLGLLYLRAFAPKVEWVVLDDEGRAHVQHPRVYCEDPSPPGDDAPDISDIQFLMNAARLYAEHLAGVVKDPDIASGMRTIFARLRRAIEEAER